MFSYSGYGTQVFTHDNYYFWIPIVGPLIGACIGAIGYELTTGIHIRGLAEKRAREEDRYDFEGA